MTTSCDDNDDDNDAHSDEATLPDTKRMAALFILKTRDGRKLSYEYISSFSESSARINTRLPDRTHCHLFQSGSKLLRSEVHVCVEDEIVCVVMIMSCYTAPFVFIQDQLGAAPWHKIQTGRLCAAEV